MKHVKKALILMIIMIGMLLSSCSILTSIRDSDKKLYLGIKNGNLEQVKEGIEDGADLNKIAGVSLSELNPVMVAFLDNRNKIADYLIENGADVNYAEKSGCSLLMFSAYNTDMHFCELLLKQGATIDKVDKYGYTALERALLIVIEWVRKMKLTV